MEAENEFVAVDTITSTKSETIKGRFSNIELLRIVLMIMIVLWHLLVHGKYHVFSSNWTLSDYVDLSVLSILFFHVNTFVFISGYFGVSYKPKKIFSFYITCLLCSLVGVVLAVIHGTYDPLQLLNAILMPIGGPVSKAWFACEYFALLLYAPLLNAGIERINRFQFTLILCVLFFSIFGLFPCICGYDHSTFNFIFMYLLGRYIHKYSESWFTSCRRRTLLLFLGLLLLNVLTVLIIPERWHHYFFFYSNPLAIISAVFMFFVFKNIRISPNRFINSLASGVFVVYLLTEASPVGDAFYAYADYWLNSSTGLLALLAIVLTIVISEMDWCARYVLHPLENRVYLVMGNKLKAVYNKFVLVD
jgi:hypothetical protein